MRTLREDLAPLETQDEVLAAVRDEVGRLLLTSAAVRGLDQLDIAVVDFTYAPRALLDKRRIFTDNCTAILEENVVIINQAFLHEAEIAVRSFALAGSVRATPFLRHDDEMFGLVQRVRADRDGCLGRLRGLGGGERAETARRREIAMALLFFVAHEIGHLLDHNDRRRFGSFVDADVPLETRLAAATAKFCRHLDEFNRYGFTLDGFEQAADKRSAVRGEAERILATLPEGDSLNQATWFAGETSADDWATRILLECLDASPPRDGEDTLAHVTATRALFAVALYAWYKDLLTFLDRMKDERGGDRGFQNVTAAMLGDRREYIRAASLFGEVHRFTLLRAALATTAVMDARPSEGRTLWYSGPDARRRQEADALQRNLLLRILMDTAVKLANVGSATGWMLKKDEERSTPQLFMMQFESLASEMARLHRQK